MRPLMVADAQTRELRDLLTLADRLRDYAAQTDDAHYVSLFLATAQTLDARARLLGFDSLPAAGAPQQPRLSN
jgi:hypothetical protein